MEENVERITAKIIEDAEKKSDEIIRNARTEAQERIDSSRARGEGAKDKLVKEAGTKAEQTRRKIVAESKIKARTIILESKEKLIEESFVKAEGELSKISSRKDYSDILIKMAVETAVSLNGGDLELVVRKEDEGVLKKELKKIEKEVTDRTKKKCTLTLSTSDIGPGVLVKKEGGAVIIDSTFENRLELLKPELRLKVAEVLFK